MKIFELLNQQFYGIPVRGLSRNTPKEILEIAPQNFFPIEKFRVWGIDISGDYDGVVDCEKLKAAGASFIIIKCSNGSLPTKLYKENYDSARKAGLIVGAYHWLYRADNVPVGAQVQTVQVATDGRKPDFYMVDFEWTSWFGKPSNPTTRDLWGMLKGLEAITKQPVVIYSAPGYLNEFFSGGPEFLPYGLVIAQYNVTQPSAVKPWGSAWDFWQAADNADGSQLGVTESKAEDLDYWRSTREELYVWLGLNPSPTPDIPPVVAPNENGGTMTKGLAKPGMVSNVKRMSDGVLLAQLNGGDYVFGMLSIQKTDLINFDHFYKADGSSVQLGAMCKTVVLNLILSNDPEPSVAPVTLTITHTIDVNSDGSLIIDGKPYA